MNTLYILIKNQTMLMLLFLKGEIDRLLVGWSACLSQFPKGGKLHFHAPIGAIIV